MCCWCHKQEERRELKTLFHNIFIRAQMQPWRHLKITYFLRQFAVETTSKIRLCLQSSTGKWNDKYFVFKQTMRVQDQQETNKEINLKKNCTPAIAFLSDASPFLFINRIIRAKKLLLGEFALDAQLAVWNHQIGICSHGYINSWTAE